MASGGELEGHATQRPIRADRRLPTPDAAVSFGAPYTFEPRCAPSPQPQGGSPAMPTKISELREELKQTRPFHSSAHEAVISILRTAAVVQRHISQVVEAGGVTIQQYNVLRILRGAGEAGLPTLAIRDRMIEEAAGITRLLDKLEAAGYVVRERSTPDRRQVLCQITASGLALLARLDEPVDAVNVLALAELDEDEKATLIRLLGAIRAGYRGRAEKADAHGPVRAGQPPR
jgi:DNA-binding MarR family transcriptional regulator